MVPDGFVYFVQNAFGRGGLVSQAEAVGGHAGHELENGHSFGYMADIR